MQLQQIMDLDQKYYMNTFGARFPVCFERGEGCTLYDTCGKPYTDFLAGIAVNALGYNHPALVDAVCSQVKKLTHCSNYFYIESQSLLAQKLVEAGPLDKAFFANSGAEANEGAIKLARKYFYEKGQDKYEIIAMRQSFHGRTMATLSATGQPKYHEPYKPGVPGFVHVPYNDADAVENAINSHSAAVLMEVIQGEGGVLPADKSYIKSVRSLCDQHGLLLIIDEIQTGMGRTGKLFAFEHYGITPDIVTLAKALGGGIPIGAFLATEKVAAAFRPGDHGTTFGGNPLACSAGLAVLHELLDNGLVEKSAKTGAFFKESLQELAAKHPNALSAVRGKGLMLGAELRSPLIAKKIAAACLEKGFVVGTAGQNTLRFVPPLIIQEQDITRLVTILDALLS